MTTDDDTGVREAICDTGSGKWFVLTKSGNEWNLMAGPYQTEAGMKRWLDTYQLPVGVDCVQAVRCDGTWRDAIPHAEAAMAALAEDLARQRGK